MSCIRRLTAGILRENPLFVMMLGTCPALAVTGSVAGALGMGVCTLVVLTLSEGVISLVGRLVSERIRLPAHIVVIAGFVTAMGLWLEAFLPALQERLGLYLSLITVNCIILGRCEKCARKQGVAESMADGLGCGIGFTLALFVIGSVREIFGAGSFLGMEIGFLQPYTLRLLTLPAGGFLVFGVMTLLFVALRGKGQTCKGCGGDCVDG